MIHKFLRNAKIDENLTTNVLIFIYFIFFIPHVLILLSVFLIVVGTINRKTESKMGGCRRLRKAWHIWSDISFLFSHSIYLAYGVIIFLCAHVLRTSSFVLFVDDKSRNKTKEEVRVGVVAARLDTFGVRFYSFFPFYYI